MTKLFESLDDLKPFIFRITDNGGATYDRITVTTCDGDAMLCTENGVCAYIEGVDVQRDADDVEAGTARDLRWIDLSEGLRRQIIDSLNEGYSNWIEAEPAAASRDEARDWQGQWDDPFDNRTPIYRDGHGFRIRDDENEPVNADQTGEGLFDSFVEAVRYMLPQDYDLSGPEYHSTVDLWDETGGPQPLWDCEAEPPTPWEVKAAYRGTDPHAYHWIDVGEARDHDHAKELYAAWQEANPGHTDYQALIGHKNNRTFNALV